MYFIEYNIFQVPLSIQHIVDAFVAVRYTFLRFIVNLAKYAAGN